MIRVLADQIKRVTPCARGKYTDALFWHAAKVESPDRSTATIVQSLAEKTQTIRPTKGIQRSTEALSSSIDLEM